MYERDARGIELAIRLLLENPPLARRLGQEDRRKVVEEFQVSLLNQGTLNTYRRLLETPLERKAMLQGLF